MNYRYEQCKSVYIVHTLCLTVCVCVCVCVRTCVCGCILCVLHVYMGVHMCTTCVCTACVQVCIHTYIHECTACASIVCAGLLSEPHSRDTERHVNTDRSGIMRSLTNHFRWSKSCCPVQKSLPHVVHEIHIKTCKNEHIAGTAEVNQAKCT